MDVTNRARFNGEKELQFRSLLKDGRNAWIYFDPKYPGVHVPASCKQAKVCVLQWGTRMEVPVRHFVISLDAVSGLLTFKGMWHPCFIPWESVDRMTGDYGQEDRFWSYTLEAPKTNIINFHAWKLAKGVV